MTKHQVFALDANVFIEAAHRYYAFDIAPAFWTNVVQFGSSGSIVSPDKVKQELGRGNDKLADWAKKDFKSFVSTDRDDILHCYGDIMEWVEQQDQYTDAAIADFASGADGWLIALAKANDYILVTHEQFKPDIQRKVPIPNVCLPLGVECIDTFEMLRRLRVQFK